MQAPSFIGSLADNTRRNRWTEDPTMCLTSGIVCEETPITCSVCSTRVQCKMIGAVKLLTEFKEVTASDLGGKTRYPDSGFS
jgi:hypothetical protein